MSWGPRKGAQSWIPLTPIYSPALRYQEAARDQASLAEACHQGLLFPPLPPLTGALYHPSHSFWNFPTYPCWQAHPCLPLAETSPVPRSWERDEGAWLGEGPVAGPPWGCSSQSLLGAHGGCSYLSGFEVSHFLPQLAEAERRGAGGKPAKNSQAPDKGRWPKSCLGKNPISGAPHPHPDPYPSGSVWAEYKALRRLRHRMEKRGAGSRQDWDTGGVP